MTPLEQAERDSRLWHIAEACSAVIKFTRSRSLEHYKSNDILRSAVGYQLMVIGEAMVRLSRVDPEIGGHISNPSGIIALRNKVVHDYPEIDDEQIWSIAINDVPILLAEVQALLPSG